jgi:GPH family glycoside/pentoside/hexuronide:cation symporter
LSIAFFFIPKDQIALMFALQIVIGLVLGPKSPLAFSMYAAPPITTNGALGAGRPR